ncbi:hypothetical protein [Sodaliphilus pleomorphus]|uniref:Uncharacterized protein n=1 Tax=Sodaliphilus pleomorphus TaxID=2606626 RepID=A0A6L5XC42_9BACT|nr:hypothetical protein [Sodaliphilus pleomorphus]MSS16778.1 hypothetical protein [Sodaliphilus pleomorphus]
MGEHYARINFTSGSPIYFEIGDFCDIDGFGWFELVDLVAPTYNATNAGYDYQLRLDAQYMKFKNKLLKYRPELSASELSFSLTSTIATHANVVKRNIDALCASDASFKYNRITNYVVSFDDTIDLTSSKLVTYQSASIIDAITQIAEAFECEWWIEDNIINFGKCEQRGSGIVATDLVLNDNVISMTRSDSQQQYFTRLYAYGSERNLPVNYRKVSDPDVTQEGVVQRRLMLPVDLCPNGYIGEQNDAKAIEGRVDFDDVYPRNVIKVGKVDEYIDTVVNEDGTTTTQKYYRLSQCKLVIEGTEIESYVHFSKDYVLEEETLHMIFESGSLNGLDFECQFNPLGVNEKNGSEWNMAAQVFEVVVNEDYGRTLPDDVLRPKVGDTFMLYNWDSTKMEETDLVALAEQELYQKAMEYLEKSRIDPSTYTCTMDNDWANDNSFGIGDKVRLVNPTYFADGRVSRIFGFEIKLDIPYDGAQYIVGESAEYSRRAELQKQVDEITMNGVTYIGYQSGNTTLYVIASNDHTPGTDKNVFSAKRVDRDFLHTRKEDTAQEAINFAKGLTAGTFQSGSAGAALYQDADGNWAAEVDNLTVRRKLQVTELDIQRLRHIGGQVLLSPAEATITEVEVKEDANGKQFILRWPARDSEGNEITNDFAVDDQVICQTFNATTQHYWWRRVWDTGTVGGKHYISVSYIDTTGKEMDCAQGSGKPQAGDKIAVLGNRTKSDRQSAIIIAGAGTGSPFIAAYKAISSYTLPFPKVYISPSGIALNVDGQVKTLDDVLQAHQADIDDIKAQADEQVVLWFGEQVPTLDNEPASAWTTDDMKLEHVKDIYYNKAARDNGGRAYSFEQVDGKFFWLNITDKDVLASLEKAERAQDTADGKRRVFVAQPVPPYDQGDLWVNATYPTEATMMVECPDGKRHSGDDPWARNDILCCAGSKAAGESFAIGDWRMAQEVTTAYASEIKQSASDIKLSVTELSSGLETAGIHIDGANSRISLNADTTKVDKDLVVGKLKTAETGARIEASGTMMEVYGEKGRNISFGVDSGGYAVLSYYDNNGVKLYDLGPNGLNYVNMSEAKMTPISVCTDADNLSAAYVDWYGFTAKRMNNVVYGDSVYTGNNQDFARQMDGKTFTAKSVSEDGLASGTVRIKGQGRTITQVRDGVTEMQEWLHDNYGIDPAGVDWSLKTDGITLLYPFTIYLVRTYTAGTASTWGEWRVKQPK